MRLEARSKMDDKTNKQRSISILSASFGIMIGFVGSNFSVQASIAISLLFLIVMFTPRPRSYVIHQMISALSHQRRGTKPENWAIALGWWIPRKYRDDLIGDILEDCYEMRALGKSNRRIRLHIIYQWVIGVVTLVPTAVLAAIRQVIIPPK
jgi:hypothetical protein